MLIWLTLPKQPFVRHKLLLYDGWLWFYGTDLIYKRSLKIPLRWQNSDEAFPSLLQDKLIRIKRRKGWVRFTKDLLILLCEDNTFNFPLRDLTYPELLFAFTCQSPSGAWTPFFFCLEGERAAVIKSNLTTKHLSGHRFAKMTVSD